MGRVERMDGGTAAARTLGRTAEAVRLASSPTRAAMTAPGGRAVLAQVSRQVGGEPGGGPRPDAVALARRGDVAGAAALMRAEPAQIDEVLAASGTHRPGRVPDVIEAAADAIARAAEAETGARPSAPASGAACVPSAAAWRPLPGGRSSSRPILSS